MKLFRSNYVFILSVPWIINQHIIVNKNENISRNGGRSYFWQQLHGAENRENDWLFVNGGTKVLK